MPAPPAASAQAANQRCDPGVLPADWRSDHATRAEPGCQSQAEPSAGLGAGPEGVSSHLPRKVPPQPAGIGCLGPESACQEAFVEFAPSGAFRCLIRARCGEAPVGLVPAPAPGSEPVARSSRQTCRVDAATWPDGFFVPPDFNLGLFLGPFVPFLVKSAFSKNFLDK